MLKHVQMLVSGHPRPTNGKFVVMRADMVQQPSPLGTVTVAPHPVPLPSGSYLDNGGHGHDIARVWLTPADFAALSSCLSTNETELTLSHNGSVVASFSFAPVAAPLHSMAQTLKALERRMNALEAGALHADLTAIRQGVEELLRRLPEMRYSDVAPRGEHDSDFSLKSPSPKKAV